MTIDPINHPGEIPKIKRSDAANQVEPVSSDDKINISDSAKKLGEMKKYFQIVKDTPDIREEKVKQAKANLESHYHNQQVNSAVLEKLVKRILKSLP